MDALVLKAGRERSVLRRHPWIFSGAVAEIDGAPVGGDTIAVLDHRLDWLAWAAYSPESQIRARIWGWDPSTEINAAYIDGRLRAAVTRRQNNPEFANSNAVRLVHGESDGVPGLIVDRYGDVLVIQFLSWGVERFRESILSSLVQLTGAQGVFERSDVEVRKLEGLPERRGQIFGSMTGEKLEITEHGVRFGISLEEGHKTGFYLDQRANRRLVASFSGGKDVLDCFCYSGGFGVHALIGGANHVVFLDSSEGSLQAVRSNLSLNGLGEDNATFDCGDAFEVLRRYRDAARSFNMIILDPPKFAPTRSQVERAARGYKDINLLAFKLLRPGGLLFTFSCSGGVDADLFQKIVAGAALDARVDAQIFAWLAQDWDHPVGLNFPEGRYLKGLACRVG